MFEIVRYRRPPPSSRELALQLAALSADVTLRQARLRTMTGLVPEAMEGTAALSALEQALAAQAPEARARLALIVDMATVAMTEIATDLT